MINLTKKVQEAGANSSAINTANGQKRLTPAEMRVQKDVNEMSLPRSCKPFWPHANDLLNFKLLIAPDEGIYKGGEFQFNIEVGANYPHEPPKVKCETKVFHPNIDLAGNVCLNILREEWKPVLSISAVIYGLQLLFLEPNPDDPLNKEAAEMFVANRRLFEQTVQRTMRGGMLNNFYFDKCAK